MLGLWSARISQIELAPALDIIRSAAANKCFKGASTYSYCTYPSVVFRLSSRLPLPQICITWKVSSSFGSIWRTERLTVTEPRLPPIIRIIGRLADKPVYLSPVSRSPCNSSLRIGEPVRHAFSFGRYPRVSGKLQQTFAADGIQILLASPGVISDSWIITGIL